MKSKIIVEMTTKENASRSWNNPEKTINELPYCAKSTWGGGYFESIEKIREFYSDFNGGEKITGCGEWEVERKER